MLVKRRKKPFDISTMPTDKTFFEITGIPFVGNDMFAKIYHSGIDPDSLTTKKRFCSNSITTSLV
jgi:hypothetical protein